MILCSSKAAGVFGGRIADLILKHSIGSVRANDLAPGRLRSLIRSTALSAPICLVLSRLLYTCDAKRRGEIECISENQD